MNWLFQGPERRKDGADVMSLIYDLVSGEIVQGFSSDSSLICRAAL